MEREVRYCTTEDGVRIAYWTLGSGRPLVLMDMPYSHAEAEWDNPAMRALYQGIARVARLVRYDHGGFGMSDRDVRFELDGFVQDLETVIDSLGLNDFSLVAHRGATASIAIAYAVRHPERLSRLVLSIGVIRWPELIDQQIGALLETGSDWRFVSESISRLVFGWEDEEASRQAAGLLRDSISLESFKEYWQASTKWDVSGLLQQVKTPTLLVHWKDHPIFGQEH